MNDRERLRDLLHEWVDGELDVDAQEWVRERLSEHPDLASEAESIRRIKHLVNVKARRVPSPPGLERRIRDVLAHETTRGGRSLFWRVGIAAAAALILGVGFWGFHVLSRQHAPQIVHAQVVREAVGSAHMVSRELRQDSEYLAALSRVGCEVDVDATTAHGLTFRGWSRESFRCKGEGMVDALRLEYATVDGKKLVCFAFEAEMVAGEVETLGSRYVKVPGAKICRCHRTEDGFTVYCFPVDRSGLHVVMLANHLLEDAFERGEHTLHTLIRAHGS